MNITEFKKALAQKPEGKIRFVLPDQRVIPGHFHITEVGHVRKDFIEIVPVAAPHRALFGPGNDCRRLMAHHFEAMTLRQALKQLGAASGRKVSVSPLAQQELETMVTARLVNVSFEAAVATLAQMADLRVVRRGDGLLVTTREQAELLHEQKP